MLESMQLQKRKTKITVNKAAEATTNPVGIKITDETDSLKQFFFYVEIYISPQEKPGIIN